MGRDRHRPLGSIARVSTGPHGLRVLVIVPAWNEQASIAETLREIHSCVPWADLLVVDDGSADRTADVAAAAGATVCRLPFNLGVGGAMRTGYRYALRHGYDVAAQIDADGQHDPRFLTDLIGRLDGADVVIGARFAQADDPYVVRGPRRWAMVLLAVGARPAWRGPGSPTSPQGSVSPTDGRSRSSPSTTRPSTSVTPWSPS